MLKLIVNMISAAPPPPPPPPPNATAEICELLWSEVSSSEGTTQGNLGNLCYGIASGGVCLQQHYPAGLADFIWHAINWIQLLAATSDYFHVQVDYPDANKTY